jgi:hypothetical protein
MAHPTNYSQTKCPKCEQTRFELVEDTPDAAISSNYKYYYLRCSSCKTFLSAFDFAAIGALVTKMAAQMGIK